MKNDLRVALIGSGLIARSSHLPAWQACKGGEVTWVVDRDPELAESVARQWSIPHWATDMSEALPNVDAVDICLPPRLHEPAVLQALEQGVHVLVEKPLAVGLAASENILQAERRADRTVMVAENWPFSSVAREAKKLLEEGKFGEPFLLQANHHSALFCEDIHPEQPDWLRDPEGSGGGYLLNAGIHSVALARHLLGEISAVSVIAQGSAGQMRFDLDMVAAVEFVSGQTGSFTFTGRSRHFGPRRLSMEIFTSEGTMTFDVLKGSLELSDPGKVVSMEPSPKSMGFVEEVQHFVDCVANKETPLTSCEDQLRTLTCVEAMYASAAAGGTRMLVGLNSNHGSHRPLGAERQ